MAVEYICDGCGKRELGGFNRMGQAYKPAYWYSRVDEDGTQIACSRECIGKVAERTKKTSVVCPI